MEQFLVFKNKFKKEGSQQPDYIVRAKVGNNWEDWGAGWIKDGANGKYISISKSKGQGELTRDNNEEF